MNPETIGQDSRSLNARVAGAISIARYHGADIDPADRRFDTMEAAPSLGALVDWLSQSGLWARGARLSFRQLMKIDSASPILLLLANGGAAIVVGRDREHGVLLVCDPREPAAKPPTPVDELCLRQVWDGTTLLARASRDGAKDEGAFDLGLLARLVWGDRSILRDVTIGLKPLKLA